MGLFTRHHETESQDSVYEVTKTEEEWKDQLSAERYAVLRRAGTEPAWSGDLLHVDGDGVFHCAGCDAPLFDTGSKFESGQDGRASTGRRRTGRSSNGPTAATGWFGRRSSAPSVAAISGTCSLTARPRPGSATAWNSLSLTYEQEGGQGKASASTGVGVVQSRAQPVPRRA